MRGKILCESFLFPRGYAEQKRYAHICRYIDFARYIENILFCDSEYLHKKIKKFFQSLKFDICLFSFYFPHVRPKFKKNSGFLLSPRVREQTEEPLYSIFVPENSIYISSACSVLFCFFSARTLRGGYSTL